MKHPQHNIRQAMLRILAVATASFIGVVFYMKFYSKPVIIGDSYAYQFDIEDINDKTINGDTLLTFIRQINGVDIKDDFAITILDGNNNPTVYSCSGLNSIDTESLEISPTSMYTSNIQVNSDTDIAGITFTEVEK